RFTLRREICHKGDDSVGRIYIRTLRSSYDGFRNAGAEVRILSVSLFITSHPGISVEFQNQGRKYMDANGPRFPRRSSVHRVDEAHIETAAQSQTFRKHRRTRKHSSVGAFFVLKKRNFEARLRQSDFLKRIEILNLLLDSFVQDCVRKSEESAARPDFVRVGSGREPFAGLHFLGNALAQLVDVYARQVALADFLLQSHAGHQILDSDLDRLLGIQIDRCIRSLSVDAYGQNHQYDDQHCAQGLSENKRAEFVPAPLRYTIRLPQNVSHQFFHCRQSRKINCYLQPVITNSSASTS